MKIPSLQTLQEKSLAVFKRFPLAMLTSIAAAILAIYLVDTEFINNDDQVERIAKIILSLVFVFPLFASFSLIKERKNLETQWQVLGNLGIIGLGIIFHELILPDPFSSGIERDGYIIFFLNLTAYLLAIYAPFITQKAEQLGIWQYNKELFLRGVVTGVASFILVLGINAILFSIDFLLNVDIDERLYLQIFFFIAGVISPLIYFDGVPKTIEELNKKQDLPKLAKGLGQYILLPLITAYAFILYLYTGKILLTREWPEGLVSFLIIGFAISGIITLLILNPFQKTKEGAWISKYTKWFYILLLPLTGMLFAAIWIRISDYGITEDRYYLVLLGIYLVIISLYFIFSKAKEIKRVPQIISIMLLLSLFGPWSAFSVSANSQTERLEKILLKNELLVDGKLIENSAEIQLSTEDSLEVRSIIRYLGENSDFETILPWYEGRLSSLFNIAYQRDKASELLRAFDIENINYSRPQKTFSTIKDPLLLIKGYDELLEINVWQKGSMEFWSKDDQKHTITISDTNLKITKGANNILNIDLLKTLELLNSNYEQNSWNVPQESMTLELENEQIKAKLILSKINVYIKADSNGEQSFDLRNVAGDLLLGFK